MDRGTLTFDLGGVQRRVPIVIGLAPEIEEATGVGCIALVRLFARGEATLRTAVAVIGVALQSTGQKYSDDALLKYAGEIGIVRTNTIAAQILGKLMETPKEATKGAGGKKRATAGNV